MILDIHQKDNTLDKNNRIYNNQYIHCSMVEKEFRLDHIVNSTDKNMRIRSMGRIIQRIDWVIQKTED